MRVTRRSLLAVAPATALAASFPASITFPEPPAPVYTMKFLVRVIECPFPKGSQLAKCWWARGNARWTMGDLLAADVSAA